MSEYLNKTPKPENEIDLSTLFKEIKGFVKKILVGIVNIFKFYYRHKFIILGLIIVAGVAGYFADDFLKKTYTNDILVKPNFGSSDYLYTKVEAIDNKLFSDDSLFLKKVFKDHYKLVKSLEIKPVIDIYNFVSRNESNQALFELLFEEDGNIDFIQNPINSRNFKYHHIYLEVEGPDHHQELSKALIKHINDNSYFKNLIDISIENLKFQLEENKAIIGQIDSIVRNAKKEKSMVLGTSELSFSDNNGLNELLGKKRSLISEKRELESRLIDQNQTVKVVDANYKVLNKDKILKKDKTKLFPFFLVIIYSLVFLLKFIIQKVNKLTQ